MKNDSQNSYLVHDSEYIAGLSQLRTGLIRNAESQIKVETPTGWLLVVHMYSINHVHTEQGEFVFNPNAQAWETPILNSGTSKIQTEASERLAS